MIRSRGKTKKKRFDRIKALHKDKEKRHKLLGSLDFDDIADIDDEDDYENEEEEYEDAEEELAADFFDFMT